MPCTIAFTGHRPERIKSPEDVEASLRKVLFGLMADSQGHLSDEWNFIAGGAPGFDTLACTLLLKWGIERKRITVIVPFQGFEKYATKDQLAIRRAESMNYILLRDSIQYLNKPGSFGVQCNLRNQAMVDKATHLISYWDGIPKGGTYNTIQMARRAGIKVINLFEGVDMGENTAELVSGKENE